jgi:nucleoid DNA-binding protein
MSRTKIDWRSSSKENYINFCKKNPSVKLTFDEWKNIVYSFNESYKNYILETGEKAKLPFGFGEFSINKKKRRKIKGINGQEFINLPIDWPKTKLKGKVIYNFNYHTEGYFFGWVWFKDTARLKHSDFWYFKPTRITSRLLAHYLKTNDKYQHIYHEWIK